MKPIHKVACKDTLRPAMMHIQIKAGFAYAVNGHSVIKMPVLELFPANIIEQNEEIYFNAASWGNSKMDKAIYIKRDGLLFTAFDKSWKTIGLIKALDVANMNEVGRFPDVNVVLPVESKTAAIEGISFDPILFTELCAAFGLKKNFYYKFYGTEKGVIVKHVESKAIGMIMPLLITGQIEENEPVEEKEEVLIDDLDDLL